jgi:predicted NodU family carbamoyl transferase
VLINTSFNVHGEPILRRMEQGLEAFRAGHIDSLVAGNKLTVSEES